MLQMLLSSRVRAKILKAFFLSPGVERNAWELAQEFSESYSAVWKEMNRLERIGILTSEQKGNAKAYSINKLCPIESELRSIVMKTEGIGAILKAKLSAMGNVEKAFIYGSAASGKADQYSDIDIMLIGDVRLENVSTHISEAEQELNRPINYVIFTEREWREKLQKNDPFATNVEESEKIILIGVEDGL
jgi:predicted nucleotidyltransferase